MTAAIRNNFLGEKMIIFLLLANLIAVPLSVLAVLESNNAVRKANTEFVTGQAEATRTEIGEHANDTRTALNILYQQKQRSDELTEPFLEGFAKHINATATAAPIVAENNQLLWDILTELRTLSAGVKDININLNNNATRGGG